ncbi:hypothetical protein SAMN05660330_02434 [Desulforhopalus singaporensis]|uniref:Uncharacterized protein n=1 Tax=Desulforhopalus singaporensis TaxID=91360 RepID=A0A1H0RV35_9BACT|nr:hypothetical protein SAMN05660330_02434 [Desulforhopalus singaporensis]
MAGWQDTGVFVALESNLVKISRGVARKIPRRIIGGDFVYNVRLGPDMAHLQ